MLLKLCGLSKACTNTKIVFLKRCQTLLSIEIIINMWKSLNCPNKDSYFISNFYIFHSSLAHTNNACKGFIWNCHDLLVQIEKKACRLNNKD